MRLRKCWLLCFILSSFYLQHTRADSIPHIGVPHVQNYSKETYGAGNQNWGLACGSNGMIYAANAEGLLAFDGQYWRRYGMPNGVVVRAIAMDEHNRIYTGGFAEFGYWEDAGFGHLHYHSVSKLLKGTDAPKDEIWKIYPDGKRVLFQSFSSVYIFENNTIRSVRAGAPYLFLHHVNDRFYLEQLDKGVHELTKDGQLMPLNDHGLLKGSRTLAMLPFVGSKTLIGTSKRGLFIMDSTGTVSPWANEANDLLKSAQLNNGLKLPNGYYAFGTILSGVFIINEQGQLVQHIHKGNGMQNNTVLSLKLDREHNIWAGLDNGIDRIEIQSPLYYYADKTGSIGTVYAAVIFDNYIYIGTNQGLFRSIWGGNQFEFKLIANSQGQVWDLAVVNGELLCGHNDGTYQVIGDRFIKISNHTGGWCFRPLSGNSSGLWLGTYNGVASLERTIGGWQYQMLEGFDQPTQYLEMGKSGQLWSGSYTGLRKLNLDASLTKVIRVKSYGPSQGLPKSPFVNVFSLNGNIVFATDSGFYRYDEIADRFSAYEQLNIHLGSFSNSNKVTAAGNNRYWFFKRGHLALVTLHPDGHIVVDSIRFAALNGRMLPFYESASRVKPNLYLISMDDGFALYRQTASNATSFKVPTPLVRFVEDITDSVVQSITNHKDGVIIDYDRNNLRFSYALPFYGAGAIQYRYCLEGYSHSWSAWSQIPQKDFTNLKQGNYRFLVQARTVGGILSPKAIFSFKVLPPWYASIWAWAVYILLLIGLLLGLRAWYRHKLAKHQRLVREKLQHDHTEQLKQETLLNDQRLVKLKNEQLEKELAHKNRELANSAMNMVYKNELLSNLREELTQLKDEQGKRLTGDQLKKVNYIIEDARSDDRDWNLFENSFNETHENFFKKLKSQYPALVPNDLKLCAYLRMNMSSKEIASLLNITTRGVEIRRYRMRKKLDLPHDKNLAEFLIEL
ncbi:Y_Y_Y domain-containing protein [bacterium A37T11]|nr:Y_Y_Y domain-containing protein [bacterium A37T11]